MNCICYHWHLTQECTRIANVAPEQPPQAGNSGDYRQPAIEPCDCGSRISHNNGGNYHDEIYLHRDGDEVFVKYDTTCELTPPAEWEACKDWKLVIEQNADWL